MAKVKRKIIEAKPRFTDLVELLNSAKDVVQGVTSLAEGDDTIQRASDLLGMVQDLQTLTNRLLYEEI
jgi:hypothetical protein